MQTETAYGPVTLSTRCSYLLMDQGREQHDATLGDVLDRFNSLTLDQLNKKIGHLLRGMNAQAHLGLSLELTELVNVWSKSYTVRELTELDGTGLKSHMRADELEIGRKFETGEDGGSGTTKQFRRLANPFGEDVVDGKIAARVCAAYDKTRGNTVLIDAGLIVRPINQELDVSDNHISGPIRTPDEVDDAKSKWDDYRKASDAIEKRVHDYVGEHSDNPVRLIFSACPTDDRDVPQDNLDEVAIEGKCVLFASAFAAAEEEESTDYTSPVLENPTWLEVCACFNDAMENTGDHHHCFLESVYKDEKAAVAEAVAEELGATVYYFGTGS